MVCNICGSEIQEGAKFCPGCGGRVLVYPSKGAIILSQTMGSLRVVREKTFLSGRKTKVFVNRQTQGVIDDGESVTILLKPGDYKLQLQTRIYPKGAALFGKARGITRTITIKPNTETVIFFSSTPFDYGRHKITRISETEWPSLDKPSVDFVLQKRRFHLAQKRKST